MCGFTKEGYQSSKNGLISYEADLSDIPPSVISELSDMQASGFSVFLLHRGITEIKKGLEHHLICPINVEAVKRIAKKEAEEYIKSQPKRFRNRIIPVVKDLVILVTLFTLLYELLFR